MDRMFACAPTKGRTQRGRHHQARRRAAMNKKQFIERMVENTDSPKDEARKHLEAFTTTVSEALKSGEEVQLPGFGKFYVRSRRRGRVKTRRPERGCR